jgi:lipopolysaccharide transport system permease protein
LDPNAIIRESQDSLAVEKARSIKKGADTRSTTGALDKPTEQIIQIIEPTRGWIGINWMEIWRYRGLLYFLTWRDVKVRYKQTALGAAWAILQPLMTMAVFTIFFGRLAHLDAKTGGTPYPIYVFIGLLPWTFFANSITNGGNSLVGNSNLITKVYFPRLILPIASVGAGLVDLGISFLVLFCMMIGYQTHVSWQLLLVPVLLVGTLLSATGMGMLLSALTVTYRDFRYLVPFLVQLWMFATPVIYPLTIVPEKWRWLLSLNPMAGIIDGFRSAFLGRTIAWAPVSVSLVVSMCLFLFGAVYFRRVERRFADII